MKGTFTASAVAGRAGHHRPPGALAGRSVAGMSTRNMHPRIVATLAELRAAGDHDAADDLEGRYTEAPATGSTATPAELAAAEVQVIEAEADAAVKIIDANADATGEVIEAQADAAAEVAEAEAATDGDADTGDVAGGPEHDHWYFKQAHKD